MTGGIDELRQKEIEQITEDHTVAAASKVDEGKLAPMFRGVLTNALGTGSEFFLERTAIDVQDDDIYIVCSDGLSNMMDDQEILFEIAHGQDKEHCCERLLDIAKKRGAPDNITSVLVTV